MKTPHQLLPLWCVLCADATLRMPGFFGDDMVLQTRSEYGTRAFLNGFAAPNETISITGGYQVTADKQGQWAVMLNPVSAGGSIAELTVTGEDGTSFTAKRVTYGDVFLCAGGRGMAAPLKAIANASQAIARAAALKNVRLLVLPVVAADQPQADIAAPAHWAAPTSANVANFSATCLLAAMELMNERHTTSWPVGLVLAARPGSAIDEWVPMATVSECENDSAAKASASASSGLWNGVINPLRKLSLRAALFSQGETDALRGTKSDLYGCLFNGLIKAWRDNGPIGDFGFSFVQLGSPSSSRAESAPRTDEERDEDDAWGGVRVGQAAALPRANGVTDVTAMAPTLDLEGVSELSTASRRLALATLHATYAKQPSPYGAPSFSSGPMLTSAIKTAPSTVRLDFVQSTAQGLVLRNTSRCSVAAGCCSSSALFEALPYANASTWVPANIQVLRNGSLYLDVGIVGSGARVRYAWRASPGCVLANGAGIPMSTIDVPVGESFVHNDSVSISDTSVTGPLHAPPLGSNSWNYYHCNIDENTVRAIADEYVRNGMRDAGYRYVNIDDCWQVQRRTDGSIVEDPMRFPSGMKALADYVHGKGLKFGLYTARGTGTCQSRPGSRDHELIDARTYCDWGIDYIKIDACQGAGDMNTSWSRFHEGLADCYRRTGRYIVQSVESCSSPDSCGQWIGSVANLWRTGGDVQATWHSILGNIHKNNGMARVANATASNFNDPDMLQVGNVGMTITEQLTHFMLWCIASAPLLAGNDIVHASDETLRILTAAELIEVNQDPGQDGRLQGVSVGPAWAALPTQQPQSGSPLSVTSSAAVQPIMSITAGNMNVVVQECDPNSAAQVWEVANGSTITQKNTGLLLTVDGCDRAPLDPFGPGANVTAAPPVGAASKCSGNEQRFTLHRNGTVTTAVDGQCLNVFEGSNGHPYQRNVDVQTFSCAKGSTETNSQWALRPDGLIQSSAPKLGCLSTKPWTPGPAPSPGPAPAPKGGNSEVWAKNMSDGSVVALLVNLDDATTQDLTASWAQLGLTAGTKVAARDLWLRQDIGVLASNNSFTAKAVPPHGGVMIKLTVSAPQ